MSESDIENWMHASDEERISTLAGWDVDNDEGKDVVDDVASLLIKECVYDVLRTDIVKTDGKWQIIAYADSDYDSLKERDIDFLGFKLVFKKSVK
jgi:hypothetical protein